MRSKITISLGKIGIQPFNWHRNMCRTHISSLKGENKRQNSSVESDSSGDIILTFGIFTLLITLSATPSYSLDVLLL